MQSRTRIKICGVCRPEDAILAARHGADAIGMIFHLPSPRNIALDRARAILAVLPPFVTAVGLFVDAELAAIVETSRALGLRHVQLHGHETPDLIASLKPLTVIKAVRVERGRFAATLDAWRESIRKLDLTNLAGLVLETANTHRPGGTGIANDWATAQDAARSGAFDGLPSIIAAGGLNSGTVAGVVRAIRPYAVDVSSGVEASLGCKSEEKIREFVQAVQNADSDSEIISPV
jgi:phosphoribosylanthranilate isomerase